MVRNKPFFWALMTILLEALLIAALVPTSFLKKVNELEYGWMTSTYSENSLHWLEQRTDAVHYAISRESGLADWMHWMFFPSEEAKAKEGAMSRLGQNLWFPYLESRGEALNDMLKTFLMRLGSVLLWHPLILLITIPVFMDGLMERKIKQYSFKYPSPFVYRHGLTAFLVISVLLGVCMLAPIPIPPLVLPVGLMILIVIMGLAVIGNMPKRL